MKLHWAAAFFSLLPVSAAMNSGIIQVTGLRAWSHPGSTRVIIETSQPADFHADRTENPDRLFFDLAHARPWISQRRTASKEINDTLVKRVRVAETSPGMTRVVFELTGRADYTVSRLDTPNRLVIELTPNRTRTPLTTAPLRVSASAATLHASIAPSNKQSVRLGLQSRKVFLPPVLFQPRAHIPTPELPMAVDAAPFTPYQMADAWVSVAHTRMPRTPTATAAPYVSSVSLPSSAPFMDVPFINTTTRVLPAIRPTGSALTPKASTDASLSLTRTLGLKINRIVIDAGHGGHDDGTIGPDGVLEKDVVLDVALRLATLVQMRLGAEVVLTRSDDTFVPLTERTAIANEHRADLFLSIHANSSPAPEVAGTETFLLNLNSSPGALAVAARENAGSDKSVGELRDILQSIAQNDKIAESQNFATNIQSSIFMQASKGNVAAHDRGVKKAPFVVLIGARMPSVLAEIGFLSNSKDESNLNKPEYRQKIAESLYRGIAQYSQSLSHFEVAGAAAKPGAHSAIAAK